MVVVSIGLNTMSLGCQFSIQLKCIRKLSLFFLNEATAGIRSTGRGESVGREKNMKSRVSKGSNFSRHEEVSQIKEREWYEISWIKKTENNGDCGNEIKRNQCNEVQGESCWSGCCNDPGLGRMRPQWLLITNYASKTLVKTQDW